MDDNIFVHNIRCNLDHEEDYELHKALMNFEQDIYKSKNDYIKKALRFAIYGDRDFEVDSVGVAKRKTFVSEEALKEILAEFKAEIMKEISEMVISLFMDKILSQLPLETLASGVAKTIETLDDELEATACKYFDGI